MNLSEFFVVGITHVDLAWKRGHAEMSEMLEIMVVRLLDALEQNPDFNYLIEQAAHYRELARRRPDLIARLKPFIDAGRVEVVGGMASTLENNLPNGECYIRNQQMGLHWVEDTWGVKVKTGWLLDTFGINAQIPQLMRGFGIGQMMANRFGGSHTRDLFSARGLDGSKITVAGWGSYAAYIHPENLSERFCKNWDDIDICFSKADTLTGSGPFLVIPYTENEMLVSLYPLTLARERNQQRPEQTWRVATPNDFFIALGKTCRTLPVVDGDLNPEFTGCFSLRHPIRLKNRRVENRLLEAEKWSALARLTDSTAALDEAWWKLHYVQFHDVFTGSHPTSIYREVMEVLGTVEATADEVLAKAFDRFVPPDDVSPGNEIVSCVIFNGLPWNRRDVVEMPIPSGWAGVARVTASDGVICPFEVRENTVRILADVPAVGGSALSLEAGESPETIWEETENATLENEWIRLDFYQTFGVAQLLWKPTDTVLMENAGSWLVAQRDDGNFQIENPTGPEVAASSGSLRLKRMSSPLGQTVRISGEFPSLSWAGSDSFLRWNAEFFLPSTRPEIRMNLHLDWKGESSRVRLTLPTRIESSTGIFEIPFGVVSRKPYSPRTNAKGEWPVHRFVALESQGHGIALVNTGVGGVEVNGGTIYTTLLRTPKVEYAGMMVDSTSSQHGHHEYQFSVIPYAGSWSDAKVASFAQEANNPLLSVLRNGAVPRISLDSYLRLEPANVVLSGIKAADDGSGAHIVRIYETAGESTEGIMTMSGVWRIQPCDLREIAQDKKITVADGKFTFVLQPFEIKTFRVESIDENQV